MPTRTRSRVLSPTADMAPREEKQLQTKGDASNRGRKKTELPWFQLKMEALSERFNPVLFPAPGKRLDFAAHESLLTCVGLWEFVNVDFDEAIREDLMKDLVVSYNHRRDPRCRRCQVNGHQIRVNRSALGKALRLPLKRDAEGGAFSVSEEEGLFLEELIWKFVVLRDKNDDVSLMSDPYMLEFAEVVKEKKFQCADWADLLFFMVERELLRGENLTNCYYASHMQLLLKLQKPEWFGGVPLESGQSQSIMAKCGKRKREFLDEVDDEGKRLRKMDLGGRELFLDEDGDEGKRLVIEGGSLDAMCQREDLLEKGEMRMPNLQVNANADVHSSECDITDVSVTQPGYSESHTCYPSESGNCGIQTAETKAVHMNDSEIFEGMESMQVTYCCAGSAHIEGRKTEGVMNLGSGASGEAHHNDQNDIIEGGAIGAESVVNFGSAKGVHCTDTGTVEEKEKGSAVEGNVGDSLDEVPCVKDDVDLLEDNDGRGVECVTIVGLLMAQEAHKDGVNSSLDSQKIDGHWIQQKKLEIIDEHEAQQNVANEAVCEASTGIPLEVHCMKEDDPMPDEHQAQHNVANEAVCEASTGIALEVHCMKEDDPMLDEHEAQQNVANEVVCEASTGIAHEVHCVKEDDPMLDEHEAQHGVANLAVCEAITGVALVVHCMKEDDSMLDEHQAQHNVANEAVYETSTGIAPEVHCMKEDGPRLDETSNENALKLHCNKGGQHVVPDEPSESHIVDLLVVPSLTEEVNTAQDCCHLGSSYGLDSQEKENQLKKVNIIENQDQFEIGSINATKMNGDSIAEVVGDGMNYQEADLSCMVDSAGMRVESWSDDFLVTREDHYGVVKKDSSMDGLGYQDTDLFMAGSWLENIGNEFSLEMPMENTRLVVQVDEPFGVEMDFGGAELSNKDDDAMGPSVSQACEGRISYSLGKQKSLEVQPVQIDLSSASSDDEECQNKAKHFERGEGSGMKGITGRTHVSLGQFPLETANFGMTAQHGHGIGTSNEHAARFRDLSHRAETLNVSVASLLDSVKASMKDSDNDCIVLQKKADEKNELIMKYEAMLQKARHDNRQRALTWQIEQQQRQRWESRCERELNLMKSVLQGHRKTIKETNTMFAKYRERSQVPEGYMAHPDGSGRLVLISEWEEEQKKKTILPIKATLENFEAEWKLGVQSGILGVYNDRLGELKDTLKTMNP